MEWPSIQHQTSIDYTHGNMRELHSQQLSCCCKSYEQCQATQMERAHPKNLVTPVVHFSKRCSWQDHMLCYHKKPLASRYRRLEPNAPQLAHNIYYRTLDATTEQQTTDDQFKPLQFYSPVITSTYTQLLSITNFSMQLMSVKTKATIK